MIGRKNKINAIFVVFLMTVITWNSILNFVSAEYGAPEVNGETCGDWYIEYGDHFCRKNETIILNGNLIINNSGTLDLSKIVLKINSTASNTFGIYIRPGGTLYIDSSTIESYDPQFKFEFIVEGYLYMDECSVDNLYGTPGTPASGIQLYSNAVIMNSIINGSLGT